MEQFNAYDGKGEQPSVTGQAAEAAPVVPESNAEPVSTPLTFRSIYNIKTCVGIWLGAVLFLTLAPIDILSSRRYYTEYFPDAPVPGFGMVLLAALSALIRLIPIIHGVISKVDTPKKLETFRTLSIISIVSTALYWGLQLNVTLLFHVDSILRDITLIIASYAAFDYEKTPKPRLKGVFRGIWIGLIAAEAALYAYWIIPGYMESYGGVSAETTMIAIFFLIIMMLFVLIALLMAKATVFPWLAFTLLNAAKKRANGNQPAAVAAAAENTVE